MNLRSRQERSTFAMANFLLFFLPLLGVAAAFSSPEAAAEIASQREFDYFNLALQWPGTICGKTRRCCPSNGCCGSEHLSWFTIHGLWADYDDGSWPSCCTRADFDLDKISSLMPKLEKYWPSLYCTTSKTCFGQRGTLWAHEWEKHGTCSSPVIKDEYGYFSSALDLYEKYNVTGMLERAGIFVSNGNRIAVREIIDAVEEEFGASPLLVCKSGAISELRLCFNKDYTPRDCLTEATVDTVGSRSSCPRYARFPTYENLALGEGVGDADAGYRMSS